MIPLRSFMLCLIRVPASRIPLLLRLSSSAAFTAPFRQYGAISRGHWLCSTGLFGVAWRKKTPRANLQEHRQRQKKNAYT
ncbi:hypothetical protein PBY51_022419 [Eleginops maclovinus]|uniref:Secreted protein n=1 Tax=Eleginops maclovinus TaxID=56733 RepID=A0AAN7XAY3_ELEMC|nr:hypothetical protein PBY51_022419 [Eleginops maclovinus]